MNVPKDLRYSRTHEWVKLEGTDAIIGITDYAQHELGDVVFVNLPEEGDALTVSEALGDVESVKAVSDILSPVTGTVREVNQRLLDSPELLNSDPYGAWIVKVQDVEATEELLDADAYGKLCGEGK